MEVGRPDSDATACMSRAGGNPRSTLAVLFSTAWDATSLQCSGIGSDVGEMSEVVVFWKLLETSGSGDSAPAFTLDSREQMRKGVLATASWDEYMEWKLAEGEMPCICMRLEVAALVCGGADTRRGGLGCALEPHGKGALKSVDPPEVETVHDDGESRNDAEPGTCSDFS